MPNLYIEVAPNEPLFIRGQKPLSHDSRWCHTFTEKSHFLLGRKIIDPLNITTALGQLCGYLQIACLDQDPRGWMSLPKPKDVACEVVEKFLESAASCFLDRGSKQLITNMLEADDPSLYHRVLTPMQAAVRNRDKTFMGISLPPPASITRCVVTGKITITPTLQPA